MNEKEGLKKDLKIRVTEFVEIIDNNEKPKLIEQETLYMYPEGYVPASDPEPIKEENWFKLFKYPKVKDDVETGEEEFVKGPSPEILKIDEKDFIEPTKEKEIHKVYKFEVIFVNLGDDYNDEPKEEIEHFIEEGLNRWNCMNASVKISDVRQRFIDWNAEEIQNVYNMNDTTFKDWNKIFAMEDFILHSGIRVPDMKKRAEQMRKKWEEWSEEWSE